MLLADEDLCVEQQAGLEHTVHGLVDTIHHRVVGIVLSQGTSRLIELGSNEVVNLLARGVPVGVGSTRNLAAGRSIQRQRATPQLEDAVVVPGTQRTNLGNILSQLVGRHAQRGGIKTLQVAEQ